MNIEDRVGVQRGQLGRRVAVQIQVLLSGVLPPWRRGLLVEVSPVAIVVKPQTEASSSQSKWPDLRVLSMAANRRCQPLIAKMLGNAGVSPLEGVRAITNHVERLVPAIIAVDH